MKPFFVSIPHSGEKVPDFCSWLHGLPEDVLMCDVDRYVDRLYEPGLVQLNIPFVKTEWHRYVADLNRIPDDVDGSSVMANGNPPGLHNRGFHWVVTTLEHALMKRPMSLQMHEHLVQLIYDPFHESIRNLYKKSLDDGAKEVFHLDVHSMPSKGTKMHRDPGEFRADIVVSDCKGLSSKPDFVDLVIAAYAKAGFKVGYNWPYFGGRVSEQYGLPAKGQHAVQVELNRSLYMDEVTKKIRDDHAQIQGKIKQALSYIVSHIDNI